MHFTSDAAARGGATGGAASLSRGFDDRLLGIDLDLTHDRAALVLTPNLCRPDGKLYGGTALAAALAVMEGVTGRQALWATVQFVASAKLGDTLDIDIEHAAAGSSADQLILRAGVGGRLVFAGLGTTGTHRPDNVEGIGQRPPSVTAPDDSAPFNWPGTEQLDVGQHRVTEIRIPTFLDPPINDIARTAMWARVRGETETTAAKLGFIADVAPVGITRAVGINGAGISLDNSIRVGSLVDSEWVLMECMPWLATGGYGHGGVLLWTPDGHLLGIATQTARVFPWDGNWK